MSYRDGWSHEGGFEGHQANRQQPWKPDAVTAAWNRWHMGVNLAAQRQATMQRVAALRMPPVKPPSPRSVAARYAEVTEPKCGGVPLSELRALQLRLRWRHSWLRRRRRAAYAACLRLIQFREAALLIGQGA